MGSGAKIAPSDRHKGTSKAQKATRAANLRTYKENLHASKENLAPPTPAPIPPAKPVALAKDWRHEYQKLARRYRHAKTRTKKLEEDLSTFKLTDATTKRTAHQASQKITKLGAVIERLVVENGKKGNSFTNHHSRPAQGCQIT
ncbi:hypothetical protein MVEN_00616000 [Mycena venus]|uniref:Uncharacterized protein n=1 Tax=Mycena venus TaxID=2733690 RepID=A0A8H7D7V2_9AGAR|nr:hypothetical protein MVEN_00616000 [Mycena venus]